MTENNIEIIKTEETILSQTYSLTPEEKELVQRVIKLIASKDTKDRELVIDYNILYSHPPEEDKEAIIAKLQERIKISRKIIAEYKELKEKYFGELMELRKAKNDVSEQ